MKASAKPAVCSPVRIGASGHIGCKTPCTRQTGGAATPRWTSEAPAFCPISKYSSTCFSGCGCKPGNGLFAERPAEFGREIHFVSKATQIARYAFPRLGDFRCQLVD